jgi:hypothetical protein
MVLRRAFAAAVLLGLVAGLAWWLQDGPVQAPHGSGASGPHAVEIRGPDQVLVWNGTVSLAGPTTALSALAEAARHGNFTVGTDRSFATLVTRIGPYAQDASGGWNFCVGQPGAWAWVPAAADQRVLAAGEGVRWVWVKDGGNGCEAQ